MSMQRVLLSRIFPLCMNTFDQNVHLVSDTRSSESKSSNLLQHTGLILHCSQGIFHFAPPLLRSIFKLEKIVDDHLSSIGGQKLQMATLCPKSLWVKTNRWDEFGDELMKTSISNLDYAICPTHEESICNIISSYIKKLSFKHLPLRLYQTTTKFRAEKRPYAGLLRCREFLMNDLYTFDVDQAAALQTYELVEKAYDDIFSEIGLDVLKAKANTGLIGGSMSHEYHIKSDVGEDKLIICEDTGKVINMEIDEETDYTRSKQIRAIEVGHMFLLGSKYSKVLDAKASNEKNILFPLEMGCYGLGMTRIIAAALEVNSTEKYIRWPVALAPYKVCILPPKAGSKEEKSCGSDFAFDLYDNLQTIDSLKNDIIIDDRIEQTIGWRLQQANLFGYPLVIVIGKSSVSEKPSLEIITQSVSTNTQLIPINQVYNFVEEYFVSK